MFKNTLFFFLFQQIIHQNGEKTFFIYLQKMKVNIFKIYFVNEIRE